MSALWLPCVPFPILHSYPTITLHVSQIIAQLHSHLSQCYTQLLDGLSTSSINEIALVTPRIQNDIIISHVLFKILNTMHVWIFQKSGKPGEDASLAEWANAFFQHTIQEVRHFVSLRSSFVASVLASNRLNDVACRRTMDLLVKRIKGYGKFYFRLAMLNPGRFVELPSCTDMIMFYWTEIEKATEAPPQSIAGEVFISARLYAMLTTSASQTRITHHTRSAFWYRA